MVWYMAGYLLRCAYVISEYACGASAVSRIGYGASGHATSKTVIKCVMFQLICHLQIPKACGLSSSLDTTLAVFSAIDIIHKVVFAVTAKPARY